MRGEIFKNTKYELLKQLQRFVFDYQQQNIEEVFDKGKVAFSMKENDIHICYENKEKGVDMEISIPLIYE